MIYVVTGNLNCQISHAHPASFGVYAVALPLFRTEAVEHPQVRLAQQSKKLKRFFRVP